MNRLPQTIRAGESRTFSIAGVRFRVEREAGGGAGLRLPGSYGPFSIGQTGGPVDAEIRIASRAEIEPVSGPLLYESHCQWSAVRAGETTAFQFHHPPTGVLYSQAIVQPDFSRAEILFSENAWNRLASTGPEIRAWELPYPLDQLLVVPVLALRGAVLLHACGAAVSNRALVFAGHSGDGKTTLAGLLSREGARLLSDERVAVRKTERGFVAFGTPWPGEGDVVSSDAHPLAGMFVLRKAALHALGSASPSLAAELLARAIVPYYLPEVAARILEVFSQLAVSVPFRELHFSRSPGLTSLLFEAA